MLCLKYIFEHIYCLFKHTYFTSGSSWSTDRPLNFDTVSQASNARTDIPALRPRGLEMSPFMYIEGGNCGDVEGGAATSGEGQEGAADGDRKSVV